MFPFVVLDQPISKHETEELCSWQRYKWKENDDMNAAGETNRKWSKAVGWWGADFGHREILPLASNWILQTLQRQEKTVLETTKAQWKPSFPWQENKQKPIITTETAKHGETKEYTLKNEKETKKKTLLMHLYYISSKISTRHWQHGTPS